MSEKTRRVVVTGLGLVTPLDIGVPNTWQKLCAGQSGVGPITRFDSAQYSVRIAGEVSNFDPADFIEKKEIKKMDRFIHFALAASQEAMDDAKFEVHPQQADRVGVYIGAGIGGLPAIEHYHKILMDRGPDRVSPFFIPMVISNMSAGQISIIYGAKGPNLSVTTACAAGTHAVGEAFRSISRGECDVAITGGSESTICPLAVGGFNAMKALSRNNENPEGASRPFDRDR